MRSSLLVSIGFVFVAVACGNPQSDDTGGAAAPANTSGTKKHVSGDDATDDSSDDSDDSSPATSFGGSTGRGDDDDTSSDDNDDTSMDPEATGNAAGSGGNGSMEICNGLDDNRDGHIDEGCSCTNGSTQACYPNNPKKAGIGACKRGTQTCTSSGMWEDATCVGFGTASAEVANGIDDNCDGIVDNGVGGASSGSGGGSTASGGSTSTGSAGAATGDDSSTTSPTACGDCVQMKCPLPSGSTCQSEYADFISGCANEAPGLFTDVTDGGCPPQNTACTSDIQTAYACGCDQCNAPCLAAASSDDGEGS